MQVRDKGLKGLGVKMFRFEGSCSVLGVWWILLGVRC